MVKRIEATSPPVTDVVEKTTPINLEDLARESEKNNASGQAEAVQKEAKIEGQKTDGLAADICGVLDMAAPFAEQGMWWLTADEFKAMWGPQNRKAIAAPAAEIMRRNGWDFGDVMDKYGPYAALAMTLLPSVVGTVQMYKRATVQPNKPTASNMDSSNATTA